MKAKIVAWGVLAVLAFGGCAASPDRYAGWYETTDGDRVIPVLKHGDEYYSVLWQGLEVPFEACPEGLVWAVTPSSMSGTTIGLDEESNSYYLKLYDAQAANFTSESGHQYGIGEKRPLNKVPKPAWVNDAKAPKPKSLDDFLGWYEHTWTPYMRVHVTKQSDQYAIQLHLLGGKDEWEEADEASTLLPTPDHLGFTFHHGRTSMALEYNEVLCRHEMWWFSSDDETRVGKIPLTRIPDPDPSESDAERMPEVPVGIPVWH